MHPSQTPAPDCDAVAERVEALLAEIGEDTRARHAAEDLVRALLTLYGTALEKVLRIVTEAPDAVAAGVLQRLITDDLLAQLLVLHDVHPLTTADRVARALDEVRPHLRLHEGGVDLLGVGDGVVRLRLAGACHGCPSSQQTAADSIERAVLRAAPEITRVEIEGLAEPTRFPGTPSVGTPSPGTASPGTESPKSPSPDAASPGGVHSAAPLLQIGRRPPGLCPVPQGTP